MAKKKKIINYQHKWKLKEVKIKDLVLDFDNARLGADHETQEEIVNDLFVNEDAMSILKSIQQIGYFPDEPPVVVKVKGKLVVLDGNRRVVSLKAMLSPSIAPFGYISKIEELMTEYLPIDDISIMPRKTEDNQLRSLLNDTKKSTYPHT